MRTLQLHVRIQKNIPDLSSLLQPQLSLLLKKEHNIVFTAQQHCSTKCTVVTNIDARKAILRKKRKYFSLLLLSLLSNLSNLSYRYIDDLISFNNKRFKELISDIYPKELTISGTTESTSVASYLDLLFTRDRSINITTKLYDKRDAFGFHIC